MTGSIHSAGLEKLKRCAGEYCRKNVEAAYNAMEVKSTDSSLEEEVYSMSDSIMHDPIKPKRTPDLGFSQAYRLHRFLDESQTIDKRDLVNYLNELDELGLPVIGTEFHLPRNEEVERLEEKLFILNMSQYQNGSLIPLSRREGNLVEIRMNPSYFPVTMANWELMRRLVPIDKTSFFLSMTPIPENNRQLEDMKSLANIIYASQYEICIERNYTRLKKRVVGVGATGGGGAAAVVSAAVVSAAVVSAAVVSAAAGIAVGAAVAVAVDSPFLGEHYLGLTQILTNGEYRLTDISRKINGRIPENKQREYQLNLYSGFGKVFPEQAYYLSMAYLAPEILGTVRDKAGKVDIRKASKMNPKEIKDVLTTINAQILENDKARRATEIGQKTRKLISL